VISAARLIVSIARAGGGDPPRREAAAIARYSRRPEESSPMRRHLLPLLAFLLLAPAAHAATMIGDASVPFSAQRTVTVNGKSYVGRLYHMPGHERHEQDLIGRDIFILDSETARGYLVVPSIHTYVEFPFPPELAALASSELTRHPEGEEQINGVWTTRYRIDHRVKGGHRVLGHGWVSNDNMLMKFDVAIEGNDAAKPLKIRMELSQVTEGPQDPALFEVPRGLTRLPTEALEPLLQGGMH
jgi:hypothetical protein